MKRPLYQAFRQFRPVLGGVFLLSLITNLLMLTPTLYMLQLYDRVLISMNTLTLTAITLITVLLFLVIAVCEWMRSQTLIKAGVRFDQQLGKQVFGLGLQHSLAGSRDRAVEAMQDLTMIRQFCTGNGVFALFDLPWTLLYLLVLFILHPMLGWVALLFCGIQFCLGVWNQFSTAAALQDSQQLQQGNQRFLDQKIRHLETLHVMGMMPSLYRHWERLQQGWQTVDLRAQRLQSRNQHISKFSRYTMQSLTLGAAAWLVIGGELSVGGMIAANVLVARALQPFDVLVSTWKQAVQAYQAGLRLNELLRLAVPDVASLQPEQLHGRLSLQLKTLSLPGKETPVLHDIDLNIEPGQIVTLMGPSGSGKTTLLRCLAGLCTDKTIRYELDGMPFSALDAQSRTRYVGYLPQRIDLVEGSIADNIARFGELDSARIIAAAQSVGLHETLLKLPQGYDTPLSAGSMPLSGGQRQLVGLARALYASPRIVLLDEPNAHLDEEGETQLLNSLQKLKQSGATVVVVSHRTRMLQVTDRLLILNAGRILHDGARDQVLAALRPPKPQPAASPAVTLSPKSIA
ncbi:type I secretion system permease/ATPase [Methylobacillus flagellatus]|uniref:type I secretion system permease/ATPase n=1 Tax=Methylobacillus flagellatus TaxID=405 RepID=UPI0010F791EA|nr:type I secretion system permease/ATPase [Methylobacillus flagellatus]